MILVFTAGMCSANQFCTCFRSSIESSKRQSTRYTVLPSRLSGRGADAFLLILGGKPTGLRTVIFSGLDSGILTVESELGVATILFMFLVPRRNVLSNIGPAVHPGQALRANCSGACRKIAERRDRCGGAVAGHRRKLGN